MKRSSEALITSVHNPRVKAWAQLLDKKGRDQQQQYMIEGVHLVQEALASGVKIEVLVYAEERQQSLPPGMLQSAESADIECIAVSEAVLNKCTDALTPQAVFAVLPKLSWKPQDLLQPYEIDRKHSTSSKETSAASAPSLVVVIDGVQDPGNLGTIIRSADAVGATGILLGKGTVDLYNPKTVRSTMGSLFHLPIASGDLVEWLPSAASQGVAIVTTSLQATASCYEFDFRRPVWFVIGNEGQGVSPEVSRLATEHIRIPMQGKAESLNAAMAATVVLFEAMRQRGL
ncbi:RNA methyltransferase [Paenibacillus sp. FSL H7-0331]|uniref:TrmH family RNA methyltransferase n=1 Tax=Paenibacillus sp. FSL H7-0331 TaxID=1920421 RepID=UPI00096FC32E|nr:RNA methyltransferase [Paenibacillus sp. FSL H7-0331]OMF05039.1 rRNA methyltransferase [Paenibacillus sp. FSL H7-0331]